MTMQSVDHILNYVEITARLGTGGQPEADQFANLAAAGYQVVINLAMPHTPEAVAHEDWLVTEHGMSYVHMPVPWETPTRAHLAQFFAVMDAFRDRRVFVHCIKNMRVAVFVYLYRVCREGIAPQIAEPMMTRIWHPEGVWRQFLDDTLDDAE